MRFSITKAALCNALSLVSRVVDKRSSVETLRNAKLQATADALVITGTDLSVALQVRAEAKVEDPGVITLPAARLVDYANLLPDGDVKVKVDEKRWATITAGRSRTRIAGMGAESFPELPDIPERCISIPAGKLAQLINRTRFAISREESRFTLNGALLEVVDGIMRMVATDGHRLAYDETECPSAETVKVILPAAAGLNVLKLAADAPADSSVSVGTDENHLFFVIGNSVLTARKLSGTFPDYTRVLPKDGPKPVTVNRADLAGAISRVAQFADERSRAIRFTLKDGLEVSAASADAGESHEALPCDYSGAEFVAGFNARYLGDFLSAVSSENIALHLLKPDSAAEFRPAGDERYRYVVMPMRI